LLFVVQIIIPFVIVSTAVALIHHSLNRSAARLLLRAAAVGDIAALTFLFLVRDEGSWLEIGMSISNFAIQNLLIVVLLLLFGLSMLYARSLHSDTRLQSS